MGVRAWTAAFVGRLMNGFTLRHGVILPARQGLDSPSPVHLDWGGRSVLTPLGRILALSNTETLPAPQQAILPHRPRVHV
jgi:hypothetical protein